MWGVGSPCPLSKQPGKKLWDFHQGQFRNFWTYNITYNITVVNYALGILKVHPHIAILPITRSQLVFTSAGWVFDLCNTRRFSIFEKGSESKNFNSGFYHGVSMWWFTQGIITLVLGECKESPPSLCVSVHYWHPLFPSNRHTR